MKNSETIDFAFAQNMDMLYEKGDFAYRKDPVGEKAEAEDEVVSVDGTLKQAEDNEDSYIQKESCINSFQSQPELADKTGRRLESAYAAIFLQIADGKVKDIDYRKAVKFYLRAAQSVSSKEAKIECGKTSKNARLIKEKDLSAAVLRLLEGTLSGNGRNHANLPAKYLVYDKALGNLRNKNYAGHSENDEGGRDDKTANGLHNVENNKEKNGVYENSLTDVSLLLFSISFLISCRFEDQIIHTELSICSGAIDAVAGLDGYLVSAVGSCGKYSFDPKMGIEALSKKVGSLIGKTRTDVEVPECGRRQDTKCGRRQEDTQGEVDGSPLLQSMITLLMIGPKLMQALYPDDAGPDTHQMITNEIQGGPQMAKVEPISFPSQPDGRGPLLEEAENQERSNALNEEGHGQGRDRTAEDRMSGRQNSKSGVDSGCGESLRDPSVVHHQHTNLKTIPDPRGQIEPAESLPSEVHHDSDLRTDGESDPSPAMVHEGGAGASVQNSSEMIQGDTAQGSGSKSPDLMLEENFILSGTEHGDLMSPPQSVRPHTPVAVSSPTCSGPVYYDEFGYSSTLSGCFTFTYQESSPVTDSLSRQSWNAGPPVVAHPQNETDSTAFDDAGNCAGYDTGLLVNSDSSVCSLTVQRTFYSYHPQAVSFVHGSDDVLQRNSFAEGLQIQALSSQTWLVPDRPRPTLASTPTQESGVEYGQTDAEDQAQAAGGGDSTCLASPVPWRCTEAHAEDDDHDHPAPVRLPPITVQPASALPPWAPQTALIDLSQAHNRRFVPLRTRRGTYDSDWPNNHSGIDPANMALAGFYRLGPGDRRVRCFYCGLELNDLNSAHNIWDEHVRHCPTCPYLLAVMGEDMVQRTQHALSKQQE